jgi:predicted Ser/Thr protein kinase
MTLQGCRECRGTVSPDAESCPHCGAPRPAVPDFRGWGFEWKSKATVFGIPLVHIAFGRGRDRRWRVARGILAIGQFAVGLVTFAQFGISLLGAGQFLVGWAVAAQFAAASLAGLGQFATGALFSEGQLALGNVRNAQFGLSLPAAGLVAFGLGGSFLVAVLALRKLRKAVLPPLPAPRAMAAFLKESVPESQKPTRAQDEQLAAGSRLGPYTVGEILGQGGMGAVYRAEHSSLRRTVALKVLPRGLARDPEFAERFRREAQALARLHHPNIVAVYDMGQEGDLCYFAMEHVDGTNLRTVLRSGGLTARQALHLVPKLCDALEYAHAQGVIHRDIKPENILIGKDGEPRIADFGLARLVRGDGPAGTLTETRAVMGTPDYMAPEQRASTHDVDPRADIFSLGVVLYEMLTGQLPLGNFEPPARKAAVDLRIDQVVMKALEADRERRYRRAVEMGTDIRKITTDVRVS